MADTTGTTGGTGTQDAQGANTGAGLLSAGIQIASTIYGMYSSNKISKYQARLAKAQAAIQANKYAAQAIQYEMQAQNIAREYGQKEYEAIREQSAYLEDMAVDAAARGGANEGTNTYLQAAQAQEFDRANAYASEQSSREQAQYMLASQQSMSDAQQAIELGNAEAASIRSQAKQSNVTALLNLGTGLLNTYSNWKQEDSRANVNATNNSTYGSGQSSGTMKETVSNTQLGSGASAGSKWSMNAFRVPYRSAI